MIKKLLCKSEVIGEVFIADSFMKRFLGYMLQEEPDYESILFQPCNSIHTFFMKFPIDVLFIDENMEVCKKIEDLKPGKIIMPVKKAVMVVEGKGGRFKNIIEGEKITVV